MNPQQIGKFTLVLFFIILSFTPLEVFAANSNKPPDVLVARIWLTGGCQIHFELRNIGPGKLAATDYNRMSVQVSGGPKTRNFSLNTIDPGKKLVSPGGGVIFNTNLKVKHSGKITVAVASAKGEKDKSNNKKSQNVNPTCDAASSGGHAGVQLVDLAVTRVWLNERCQVNIELQNVGKGAVPVEEYRRINVQVAAGTGSRKVLLYRVDSDKRLIKPGGQKQFNTGLKLEKPENVTVRLDPAKGEKNKNNNTLRDTLHGDCSSAKPDLAVEKIGLDKDCTLLVALNNRGKGGLSNRDYSQATLEIQHGAKIDRFPLKNIDRQKALSRPGGRTVFKSGIKLHTQKPVKVTARLTSVAGDENKKNDNNVASLNPQCVKGEGKPGKAIPIAGGRAKGSGDSIQVALRGGSNERLIGENLIVDIELSDPDIIPPEGYNHEEFPLGYPLAIETTAGSNWRQLGYEILSRTGDGRRMTMRFSLPAGLELNKRYVITYTHTQLDAETLSPVTFRGRSEAFNIRPAGAVDGTIRVTTPRQNGSLRTDRRHQIEWHMFGMNPDEYFFTLVLERAGEVVETLVERVPGASLDCKRNIESPICWVESLFTQGTDPSQYGDGQNQYRVILQTYSIDGNPVSREASGDFTLVNWDTSNSPDFAITDLRVSEAGQLEAYVSVTPPESGRMATFFEGRFVVDKGATGSGILRTRTITAHSSLVTHGWIDLGHIDSYTTPEERRAATSSRMAPNKMEFAVSVNIPATIAEDDFSNNTMHKYLRVNRFSIRLFGDIHDETLYYEGPSSCFGDSGSGLAGTNCRTEMDIRIVNEGYQTGMIMVSVQQLAGHRPGELDDGNYDTINLGSLETSVPPNTHADAYHLNLFAGGRLRPEWREGYLIIRFQGEFYPPVEDKRIRFTYRSQ